MKWRLKCCASAQSAAGRRTKMHNTGAVMVDALLKDTPVFLLTYPTQTRFALGSRLDRQWSPPREKSVCEKHYTKFLPTNDFTVYFASRV